MTKVIVNGAVQEMDDAKAAAAIQSGLASPFIGETEAGKAIFNDTTKNELSADEAAAALAYRKSIAPTSKSVVNLSQLSSDGKSKIAELAEAGETTSFVAVMSTTYPGQAKIGKEKVRNPRPGQPKFRLFLSGTCPSILAKNGQPVQVNVTLTDDETVVFPEHNEVTFSALQGGAFVPRIAL